MSSHMTIRKDAAGAGERHKANIVPQNGHGHVPRGRLQSAAYLMARRFRGGSTAPADIGMVAWEDVWGKKQHGEERHPSVLEKAGLPI